MRKAGILMPVASLPSRYGCGDFGPQAYHFAQLLKQAGFSIWQILPLNPLGYGNSPYQPYSSYAMDDLYLSLDLLAKEGLIQKIQIDHKTLEFSYYNKNGRRVEHQMLSSGEKQILVILLTVLVEDKQPYVLFMDEPEISLHVEWQQKLIDLIRQINPKVQIILTTHSPAVIMNGWMDAVTEVSDITKE